MKRSEPGAGMAGQFRGMPVLTREGLQRRIEKNHQAEVERRKVSMLKGSVHEYRMTAVAPGPKPGSSTPLRARPSSPLGDSLVV